MYTLQYYTEAFCKFAPAMQEACFEFSYHNMSNWTSRQRLIYKRIKNGWWIEKIYIFCESNYWIY